MTARWLPAVGWLAFIFVLSHQSGLRFSPDDAIEGPLRNAVHVAIFAVLGALLVLALDVWRDRRGQALAISIGVGYGVLDEVHQAFVPLRTGDPVDVALDAIGVVAGVTAAAWWAGRVEPEPVGPEP